MLAHCANPAAPDGAEVREAVLATRTARVAGREALARAAHEPVRHRGLSRAAADGAEAALARLGRVTMLMEAHLPDRDAAPLPAAAALTEALRHATERGAEDIRERRVPRRDEVHEARVTEDEVPDAVVRNRVRMLGEALGDLSDALEEG
ncbi:hypothetical protein [Streptomyces sp. NPDC006368]|uniref:hypothetical protein n=1 Tax=Streptomyces sp. NPDC006368 TaxID=3156760 RepID=UPI0033B861FF